MSMISCIVTTYKRSPDIVARAINSIVNQTYKDIEIIVVNDAPEEKELSQNIEKILSMYDASINYIIHKENKGACAARNTGIAAANGEYIAFLDDDDEWVNTKLEIQLSNLIRNNSALVYCDQIYIDAHGNKKIKEPFMTYVIGKNDYEKLLCYNFIGSTSFPLIKANALKEVGGFNEKLESSQDHEVWLKIAKKYTISYVNKPLVKYYYSDVAITRSIKRREQGYEYLLNEFKSDYKMRIPILHRRYMLLSSTFFGIKCFKQGLKYWWKAIKLSPFSSENLLIIKRTFLRIINPLR